MQLQNRTVATKLGFFYNLEKAIFSPIQLHNPALATKKLSVFTCRTLYSL